MGIQYKNDPGPPARGENDSRDNIGREPSFMPAEQRPLRSEELNLMQASGRETIAELAQTTDPTQSSQRPTYTLEEITAEYRERKTEKLWLASHLVYPHETPCVQDFEQLVSELATRMIRSVPDEMKNVSPDDVRVHLVDRPSVNAFVHPSQQSTFDVFINRGLLEEFLTAPELTDKDLCIDALAGVIAHELCHANFKRAFQARANSMIQEEYCDVLPGKMLERSGLRPEAMSRLCDLLARVTGENEARRVSANEPHATAPIRKEIFEKGAWEAYERERRKDSIDGLAQSTERNRAEWRDRLEKIVESVRYDRIISPVRHEALNKGFASATADQKLDILERLCMEQNLHVWGLRSKSIIYDLCDLAIESLSEASPPQARYSQHPLLIRLSTLLYSYNEDKDDVDTYRRVARALHVHNFGAFEKSDEIYLALLNAKTPDDVVRALRAGEALADFLASASIDNQSWGETLLPRTLHRLQHLFQRSDFEALREGHTIPFPFAAHETVRREILTRVRRDEGGRSLHRSAMQILDNSGVIAAVEDLLGTSSKRPSYSSPTGQLCLGVESSTRNAFSISLHDGISLKFPTRAMVNKSGAFEPNTERETRFAQFIAKRGEDLLAEAEGLGPNNIFNFAQTHAHLIMPQLYPVGLLPADIVRSSQRLAEVFFERLDFLLAAYPSHNEFRQEARDFVQAHGDITNATFLWIYHDYHMSIGSSVKGPRVDPGHPLIRAILGNSGGLLTKSEQLLAVSRLNLFEGGSNRSVRGEELHSALATAVGGEDRLKDLLGVDLTLPPRDFIASLSRFPEYSPSLYEKSHMANSPVSPLREVRTMYIRKYLSQPSEKSFTVEQLHILYDLCSDSRSSGVANEIREIATKLAKGTDLSQLSNPTILDMYKRLVAMGVLDRSVSLDTAFQRELIQRAQALKTLEERKSFLSEIAFPQPFSAGETNSRLHWVGAYDQDRFKELTNISSLYRPQITELNFETFISRELVDIYSRQIRERSGVHYDDKSGSFLTHCQELLQEFDKRALVPSLRARVLRGVADELLLQPQAAFTFRDNLTAHSKYQSHASFANLMMATHQSGRFTNKAMSEAHNALIDLRSNSERDLREALFEFLLSRRAEDRLAPLSEVLLKKLKLYRSDAEWQPPSVLAELGIKGVQGWFTPEERSQEREIIEYHLRSIHQRFSELDVRAKGAALSTFAVDNHPTERSFNEFRDKVLIPRVLPKEGPYNELILSGIKDYFEFYSNAVHHKYMVACTILASAQADTTEASDLAKVGLVAKSFLGAHGTAGYKLLQRIRNYPSTPQEIKAVLHNVLDETISFPRWTIHERIAEFGPPGATDHWVGRAKAGSLCLSVPLKKQDGSESFLSLIHPGAHVDSLYWLQNFTTMASHLSELNEKLGVLAPMAQQTRRLIENETNFAESPAKQQEVAERAYTYTMDLPAQRIKVRSSCAPLISSQARPHRTDFMKNSGNKEAGRVAGRSLLEMVAEFREKSDSGKLSPKEQQQQFAVLRAVALSVLANEVRLVASGKGKDHDRHPGNYLIETVFDPRSNATTIDIRHFDFGCTDLKDPGTQALKEIQTVIQREVDNVDILSLLSRRAAIADSITKELFDRGKFVPEVASVPLGLLAAIGANERVRIKGKERPLLDARDIATALKVGLEGAEIPAELEVRIPKGIKGWLIRRGFGAIETNGIVFSSKF